LVLEWIAAEGGVAAIEKRNEAKARLLYDAIDASGGYYLGPIEKNARSRMNVTFRVGGGSETLETKFAKEAAAARLVGLGGHRSVGGMRASIYNAVTIETVGILVDFMRAFQKANG
jgi:phosphoserine aminotransferase